MTLTKDFGDYKTMIRTLSNAATYHLTGLQDVHAEFWKDYRALWEKSLYQSPFQAPEYLRYLSGKTSYPVVVFQFFKHNTLLGATLFKIRNKTLLFLSEIKSDHNYFLIHGDTTAGDWDQFFEGLFQTIEENKYSCEFNSLAGWATYQKSFEDSYRSSALFSRSVDSAVCPMLIKATPAELGKKLRKSKTNRYKRNRLIREQGVTFHADTDLEGLSDWVRAFCACHIARWSGTSTPSAYLLPKKVEALEAFLRTWHADDVLVRFSIRKEEEIIAFCIGLRQQNSLIYHSPTYNFHYNKYSLGQVLIMFMGEWMESNDMSILDFGHGNESYKYRYANEKGTLKTLFAAPKSHLLFCAKAMTISFFREHPYLSTRYRQYIGPIVKRAKRLLMPNKSVYG